MYRIARLSLLALGACLLVPALISAETAPTKPVLADRHKAAGLSCEDCHGKGPKKALKTETCLSCHESYPKVAERTAGLKPNPHENHLIDLDCDLCHKGHQPQVNYCTTCHEEMAFMPRK